MTAEICNYTWYLCSVSSARRAWLRLHDPFAGIIQIQVRPYNLRMGFSPQRRREIAAQSSFAIVDSVRRGTESPNTGS